MRGNPRQSRGGDLRRKEGTQGDVDVDVDEERKKEEKEKNADSTTTAVNDRRGKGVSCVGRNMLENFVDAAGILLGNLFKSTTKPRIMEKCVRRDSAGKRSEEEKKKGKQDIG